MAVAYYNYVLSIYGEREARKIQRKRLRDISNPFDLGDKEFQSVWRISKPLALYLVERLKSDLEPHNSHSESLPVHIKMLCSVQFLANGGSQKQIGQYQAVSTAAQTTVSSFLRKFLEALHKRLFEEWVHFPRTSIARESIAKEFEEKCNVADVLGILDCTHVYISPPAGPIRARYHNKKMNSHAIKVQLVADSECRIIHVNARYPGSVKDAFIWKHSSVNQEMRSLHETGTGKYFLLADSNYSLEPWLMTPISEPDPYSPEERYNDWHCNTIASMDRTKGCLRGTLKCLASDRILYYRPDKVTLIVYACCILYNLMKHYGVLLEEANEQFDEHDEDEPDAGHLLSTAQERRAELIRKYFTGVSREEPMQGEDLLIDSD